MAFSKRKPHARIHPFRDDEDKQNALEWFARGKTVAQVAAIMGWSLEQTQDLKASFFPTTGLAQMYLRSHALTLAKRVVEEANVEESLDLLSRRNIGVLAPVEKGLTAQPTAVLTSVRPEHLGGVQVAVIQGATHGLSEPVSAPQPSGWVSAQSGDRAPDLGLRHTSEVTPAFALPTLPAWTPAAPTGPDPTQQTGTQGDERPPAKHIAGTARRPTTDQRRRPALPPEPTPARQRRRAQKPHAAPVQRQRKRR